MPVSDVTALTSLATTSYAFGDAPNWRTLAAAKVFVPRISANVVPRPRLIERLNASMASPLTLLIAPAGFGKTTVLIQWMRQAGRSVAWLSVDEHESDVARFAFDMMVALRQALRPSHPDFGVAPHPIANAGIPFSWQVLASVVLEELQTVRSPLTIIFDDYHFVHDESINAFLALIIERLPETVNIVISSRRYPALPLSRMRARGLVSEITTDMLRFAPEETERFLARTVGRYLHAIDFDQLMEKTEGWIAGLQLAATGLQDGATVKELFGGSKRTLEQDDAMDYLCEEVLVRQPKEVQDFLLKTSVLDRFCANLCDYVTGIMGAEGILARLQDENLFIVPLDDEGVWYRYHHLFRALLRNRLAHQQPEIVADLQRRASRWYAQQQLLPEAVAYAVDAGDWDQAVELIKPTGAPLLYAAAGRIRTWLESLPDEAFAKQPILAIWRAWLSLSTGNIRACERIIRDIENRENGSASQELRGEILGLRAIAAVMANDGPTSISLGNEVLEMSPVSPVDRYRSFFCIGCGLCNLGRPWEGEKWLRQASDLATDYGHAAILSQLQYAASLARCVAFQGRFKDALALLDKYERIGERLAIMAIPLLSGYRAEILWGLDDLSGVEANLARSLTAMHQTGLQFRRHIYWQQKAKLLHSHGDSKDAIGILDDLYDWCRRNGNEGAARDTDLLRAEIKFDIGERRETQHRFAKLVKEQAPSQIAYQDEEEYRFFVRWLLQEAGTAPVCPPPVLALQIVNVLRTNAVSNGRKYDAAKADVLEALALHKLKRLQEAVAALDSAACSAFPEGAVRVFLDDREAIRSLLLDAEGGADIPPAVKEIGRITRIEEEPDGPPPVSRPVIDISSREQEVLSLIAMGLTNQEIADHLVVSLNTIKTHVKNIYFKLDARSRTQAVALARDAGLI